MLLLGIFVLNRCWNRLKLIELVKRCLIYLFRDGEIFEIDIISMSATMSATILVPSYLNPIFRSFPFTVPRSTFHERKTFSSNYRANFCYPFALYIYIYFDRIEPQIVKYNTYSYNKFELCIRFVTSRWIMELQICMGTMHTPLFS